MFDNVRLDATAVEVPPLAPTNLAATAGNAQVALTWTASLGATGYNVKRLTGDGGSVAETFPTSGTSYTETGLTNFQTYYYVVSATNALGEGDPSTQVSATPVLPAPANLAATAGNQQISLSWTASSGATGYNVKRLSGNGGSVAATFTTSETSYTETGLTNGTTYYYVVSATDGVGEGANSTQVSATPALPLPPAAPTNLVATAGNAQVVLSWTPSSGATGYTVQRSMASGSGYSTIGNPSGTSYTDSTAVNGTTYYYVVSASNGAGPGANSTEVSAMPSSTVINVGDSSFEIGGATQGNGNAIVSPWVPGTSWGYVDGSLNTGGLSATNGRWHVYCNANSNISQTLTDTLQPDTVYTLSVDVGRRSDLGMPGYSISLYAGSTLLASASGGNNSFSPGWITAVATYTSPSSVTAGQALRIVLGGSGVQTEFDNVRLAAVTGGGSLTYTDWATANGLTDPTNPNHVGPDGLTNLLVYALDLKTDGTNGSPGTLTGNQISFTKRDDAVTNNDVTYSIEISADLGVSDAWHPVTITSPDVDNATTISYTLPSDPSGKLFARLVVTQK